MSRIIEACVAFFEADEWPFERIEELPMVRSRYAGRHGNYDCWFQDRPNEQQLMFYARAPTNAVEDKRQAVAEFMTRANYGMVIGNFELDFEDGEIRFKTQLDVDGAADHLVQPMLRNLVVANVLTVDRYFEVLQRAMHSDEDPAQLIAMVEGPAGSQAPN